MSNQKMTELLKRQEEDRQDLAAGVYDAWQPIATRERELLADYQGNYETAPPEIQQEIIEAHQQFFAEWGGDGRLAALMASRHIAEREKLAAKQTEIDKTNQRLRKNDNDRGR